MLRVGLTGSIGVGKSFVAGVLGELGCHVLDADTTAREVVEPGAPGLKAVVTAFGAEVLRPDGSLDRQRLGDLIFADEALRQKLNGILHPLIIARQDEWLRRQEEADPHGIAVIDAALMIESGGYERFDRLIIVHCNAAAQLHRVMSRNKLSAEAARQRINSQMPQEEKMKLADYLIDTSGDYSATRKRVEEVYRELKALAAAQ